jgi:hypothetical protein
MMSSRWSRLRLDDLLFCLILAGIVCAVVGRTLTGFEHDIFEDDAYYYTVLARNIAASHSSTFDGISRTNGAHPLLLAVQVLLALFLGPRTSPLRFYSSLMILYAVFLLGFVILLFILRRGSARNEERGLFFLTLAPALAYMFLPQHLPLIYQGMESVLAFPLCVLLLIWLAFRKETPAGLAGLLLVAARLDTFTFVLLPLAAFYALAGGREKGGFRSLAGRFLHLALPASVFVGLYMLYNWLQFGHSLPIHGVLKSSFPHVHLQVTNLFGLGHGWTARFNHQPFRCLLAGAAAGLLLLRRGKLAPSLHRLGIVLLLVTATELGNLLLFQKWGKPMTSWYVWLPLFTSMAALAFGLAHQIPARGMRLLGLGLGGILFLTAGTDAAHRAGRAILHPERHTRWEKEIIRFIRTTPDTELWAATDCGRLAYWGERRFVNLDGLVNGFAYQERLRRGELADYLREKGVRYLAAVLWDRAQTADHEYEPMYKCRVAADAFSGNYELYRFFVYSYLYGRYSDALLLPKEAEIWRSAPYRDGEAQSRYAVYDLSLAHGSAGAAAATLNR